MNFSITTLQHCSRAAPRQFSSAAPQHSSTEVVQNHSTAALVHHRTAAPEHLSTEHISILYSIIAMHFYHEITILQLLHQVI